MAKKATRPTIRIELTPEQPERVREATGKEASTLELTPEELEERVAPWAPYAAPEGPPC